MGQKRHAMALPLTLSRQVLPQSCRAINALGKNEPF
jgi:hypothetical protein